MYGCDMVSSEQNDLKNCLVAGYIILGGDTKVGSLILSMDFQDLVEITLVVYFHHRL